MKAPRRLARDPNLGAAMREVERMTSDPSLDISRRTFLKVSGLAAGGLTLAFCVGCGPSPDARAAAAEFEPNAFLTISPDGSILILSKGPEIGQGIKTAFPMIVAEELDARWADVKVEQAPIDRAVFGRQSAGGSRSIPSAWDQLRTAGATARAMLVTAAAQEWKVPEDQCNTEPSVVVHVPTGRRLSYGELALAAAKLPVPAAGSVKFKRREDYRLLGRRISGVDNEKLLTGQPLFGVDQKLPGMLYATYAKCPATGGRPRKANLETIRKLPGVRQAFILQGNDEVTELMPGVAILADSTWQAMSAREQLVVDWDESEASTDSWADLASRAQQLADKPGKDTVRESGDTERAFANGARTVEAFYSYPFLSHAPLEPQNCTAWYRDGELEVWAPTQAPQRAVESAATLLGLPQKRVTLHQTRVGGGFGRRLRNDYVCEAAAIARQAGVPVKLQWSREDDMAHDFYRPAGFHALRAALDDAGRLTAWQDHFISFTNDGRRPVSGGGMRGGEFPDGLLGNYRITQTLLPLATPTGPWRAPGSNGIAFAVQCFHNELAAAAGRDHLQFLLETLGEPRWLEPGNPGALHTGRAAAVIKLAAEKAGWDRPQQPGRGLGLAFYFCHLGHVAEVADVSVDSNQKLTVHRVTVAVDVGPVVNLSGAENQCQGAVIDGLSTMYGLEVTMENGRIQQSNYDEYPLLRMPSAPAVDVHFIQSDYSPTGLGEPALPPLAPAVCNAIFAATGRRVRSLPLSREGFSI